MIAMLVTSCFGSHIRVDFFWWYIGAASAVWLNALGARRAAQRQLWSDVQRLRRDDAHAAGLSPRSPGVLAPGVSPG